MTKIRFATDDIKHITLFESMTGAKVKDFLRVDDSLCFVVGAGEMGLAIGKKGVNVEKVRKALGKPVIVFEYNPDEETFLKNMFHPVEIHGIQIAQTSDDITAVVQVSREDRSRAIGAKGSKIKAIREVLKRHSGIAQLNLRAV